MLMAVAIGIVALTIVMMVVMLMLMAMAIGIVALAVMMMVMMVMRFSLCQTLQFFLNCVPTLHCHQQLLAVKLSPRSRYDHRSGIMLFDQRNRLSDLLIGCVVGVREHNTTGIFNLIVEELTEIAHIHFAFVHVRNGCKTIEHRAVSSSVLHRADDIRKLSDTRRLNKNTVGTVLLKHFFESFPKISNQRTANTTAVHFGHLNACILHKSAVDADLSKFILNQYELFTRIGFLQQLFDERCFSRSEKSRKNINFRHLFHSF